MWKWNPFKEDLTKAKAILNVIWKVARVAIPAFMVVYLIYVFFRLGMPTH